MKKVLFILKRREGSGGEYSSSLSTGLLNSSLFVKHMLDQNDVRCKLVVVTDNNDIDREVTLYRPTHVIIEALWVVPEKFEVLRKLHPSVKWIVRIHSDTPFLANEGSAMDWIHKYSQMDDVFVAANSPRFYNDIQEMLRGDDRYAIKFLPNYYPVNRFHKTKPRHRTETLRVGCFGAIRPLKNQLTQAMAAIKFAEDNDYELEFHINAGRIEQRGMSVLKNLEALFDFTGHYLVEHPWLEHRDFLEVLRDMDLCMQVSFSETFNIVAADSIASGVPTVVSKEVPWASIGFADPNSMESIVGALRSAWKFRRTNVFMNQKGLESYVLKSEKTWLKLLG